MISPFKLEPVYLNSIWAGKRLGELRNIMDRGVGISREVCTYPGSENMVATGSWKGHKITEMLEVCLPQVMGCAEDSQLIRVAYMDTAEDLSIQVHPDEFHAALCGDYEKSESWYIVEAGDGAYITAGVRADDKKTVKEAVCQNRLEELLTRIPVKAGDFVMIPAGMVHACGKNILALEIGSFGGITYRLYDYGRGRELNLEKGLEVIDPSLTCEVKHMQTLERNHLYPAGRHKLFQSDVVDVSGEWKYGGYACYRILTCVKGNCEVHWNGEGYPLSYTETIVIPAACREIQVTGEARLVISSRC